MTATITEHQVLTVLKHLVKGKNFSFVASATLLGEPAIKDIAESYGWPDRQVLARSLTGLEKRMDTSARRLPPSQHRSPRPQKPVIRTSSRERIDTPEDAEPTVYVDAIAVSDIFADHTYQRDLDTGRVTRMAKAYDPQLVGILEVALRKDGRFAVIDGQHRWEMLKTAHPAGPRAYVACNVHTGLTVEQEAQLFYDIDKHRRRLTGWDRWNARRGAGEQVVLDIEATATAAGFSVEPRTTDGTIRCVGSMEKIVNLSGLQLLDSTLAVIVGAFGRTVDAVTGELVHGTALVLAYYGPDELDVKRLVSAMQSVAPRQVLARADALREVQKGQKPRLVASVLVDRYNSTSGKKLQAFAERMPAQAKARGRGRLKSRQEAS